MRSATIQRKTAETDISLALALDGTGESDIRTGWAAFWTICSRSLRAMPALIRAEAVRATRRWTTITPWEDIGIALGQALYAALSDKRGVRRYGQRVSCPWMTLWSVAVDLSYRAYLGSARAPMPAQKVGGRLIPSWSGVLPRLVRSEAALTLHIRLLAGANTHHVIEGIFKGVGSRPARLQRSTPTPRGKSLHQGHAGRERAMIAVVITGKQPLLAHLLAQAYRRGMRSRARKGCCARRIASFCPACLRRRGEKASRPQAGCVLLRDLTGRGKPLIGICLGMQLLFEKSHEYGEHAGLGLICGEVRPLAPVLAPGAKVPHMGWNSLHLDRPDDPLLSGVREGDFVYYVHSFYAAGCGEALAASSEYGGVTVAGVVRRGCVCGTQFHPEKSGEVGLRILRAFAMGEGDAAC